MISHGDLIVAVAILDDQVIAVAGDAHVFSFQVGEQQGILPSRAAVIVADGVLAEVAAEAVGIAAGTAIEIVVTCAAIDEVVAGRTIERVIACRAKYLIAGFFCCRRRNMQIERLFRLRTCFVGRGYGDAVGIRLFAAWRCAAELSGCGIKSKP